MATLRAASLALALWIGLAAGAFAHSGSPGKVQNEAVTRMLRSFPELGIEFAK